MTPLCLVFCGICCTMLSVDSVIVNYVRWKCLFVPEISSGKFLLSFKGLFHWLSTTRAPKIVAVLSRFSSIGEAPLRQRKVPDSNSGPGHSSDIAFHYSIFYRIFWITYIVNMYSEKLFLSTWVKLDTSSKFNTSCLSVLI